MTDPGYTEPEAPATEGSTSRAEDSMPRAEDTGSRAEDSRPGAEDTKPGADVQEPQQSELLSPDDMQRIVGRWRQIQEEFVDEPRQAVQDADALVTDLMTRLAQTFAHERDQLESRWAGGEVSTEDLRQGLQRYRSFFERLLAA
jgi:hypothetical protein